METGTLKGEGKGCHGSVNLVKSAKEKTGIAAWDAAMLDEERRIAQQTIWQDAKEVGPHRDPTMSREAGEQVEDDAREGRWKNCRITPANIDDGQRESVGYANSITHVNGVHETAVENHSCDENVMTDIVSSALAAEDDHPKAPPMTRLPAEANNENWANVPKAVEALGAPCGVQDVRNQQRQRKNLGASRGLKRALDLATRCLAVDGTHANAYMLRAEVEEQLGRRSRAIADFEAASLLSVGDPRPRINEVENALREYALHFASMRTKCYSEYIF